MAQVNESINVAKGVLILLVVVGHVLYGSLSSNIFRFLIYSFHMPLFLFISGYLINITKIDSIQWPFFFSHYWNRMLKAWLLAWVVYTAYDLSAQFSFDDLAHSVISPFYHLWYIPSLFFMLFLLLALRKTFKNERFFWGIVLLGSVILLWSGCVVEMPRLMNLFFVLWFVVGLFCRNKNVRVAHFKGRFLIPFLFLGVMVVLYFQIRNTELISYRGVLCAPFVLLLILLWFYPYLSDDVLPKIPVFSFLGQKSLIIYLWHMIPVLILRLIFPHHESWKMYVSSLVVFVVLSLVGYYSNKRTVAVR